MNNDVDYFFIKRDEFGGQERVSSIYFGSESKSGWGQTSPHVRQLKNYRAVEPTCADKGLPARCRSIFKDKWAPSPQVSAPRRGLRSAARSPIVTVQSSPKQSTAITTMMSLPALALAVVPAGR